MLKQLLKWWRRPRFQVDAVPTSGPADATTVLTAMVKDLLVDRRAERRSKSWRAWLLVLIFGAPVVMYAGLYAYAAGYCIGPRVDVVGVVHIDGEISGEATASADRVTAALNAAFESEHVKAVVLSIDSPGGATVEAERIYRAIKRLRTVYPKPIVAVINNLGASAAYLIALHADRIVVARYSLVGSVGAIIQGWDAHRALQRLDLAARVYASGELKTMFNPYLAMSPAAETKARELVARMGEQFRGELDQQRRGKLKPNVDYSSGEVWGGVEAQQVGLVDEIGTVDDVVREFAAVEPFDFGPHARSLPFLGAITDSLDGWVRGILRVVASDPLTLR